jgi:hypothetical protein
LRDLRFCRLHPAIYIIIHAYEKAEAFKPNLPVFIKRETFVICSSVIGLVAVVGNEVWIDHFERCKREFQAKERRFAGRRRVPMEKLVQQVEKLEQDAEIGGAEWVSVMGDGEIVAEKLVARK